jgi:hypothetical protein
LSRFRKMIFTSKYLQKSLPDASTYNCEHQIVCNTGRGVRSFLP